MMGYTGSKAAEVGLRGGQNEGMPINRLASTPLYIQLKNFITAQIERGDLKPGDRILSEPELEREHGVSRITIRQAISALVHDDKLYRVPGKGTYVASPKLEPLSEFTSFSENMAAKGLKASYRALEVEWLEAPPHIRDELRLGAGERVLYVHRLLLADGAPICIQRAYFPERFFRPIASQLTRELLGTTSIYSLLEHQLRLQLWKAEEIVEPARARREEVGLLGIPRDAPVLVVNRLSYLVSGEPVETVKLVFRGDKYRYRVDLFRRPRPTLEDESRSLPRNGGHQT
jgi:GntR family transcriptional regulator